MNSWFRLADVVLTSAPAVLAVATVLLSVTIVLAFVMRSAAARHAVIFSALITVGLLPAFVWIGQHAGARRVTPVRATGVFDYVLRLSGSTPTAYHNNVQPQSKHQPLGQILLACWLAGAMLSGVSLLRGMNIMARARRSAKEGNLRYLRERLRTALGSDIPEILTSEQAHVPVALGCWRTVVLLPNSFPERFNEQQLLQILLHECAHALRRDPVVGLYQRSLAAVLWFHPLVHIANRLLDRSREELCDNYVLSTVNAGEYSRTLLAVAKSLMPLPTGWFSPALVGSKGGLELRVAGLLNPGRSTMTKLTSKTLAIIVATFICSGLALSCITATPAPQQDSRNELTHVVPFELGTTYSQTGDVITIDDVRGTADTIAPGNMYQVKGTYKLLSHDSALLVIYVTTDRPEQVPVLQTQKMQVAKGEGRFTLLFYMWGKGSPHVSFYPIPSGSTFAGVYFGTGDSVFRKSRTGVVDHVTDTPISK